MHGYDQYRQKIIPPFNPYLTALLAMRFALELLQYIADAKRKYVKMKLLKNIQFSDFFTFVFFFQ